jgi:hypothetical protein
MPMVWTHIAGENNLTEWHKQKSESRQPLKGSTFLLVLNRCSLKAHRANRGPPVSITGTVSIIAYMMVKMSLGECKSTANGIVCTFLKDSVDVADMRVINSVLPILIWRLHLFHISVNRLKNIEVRIGDSQDHTKNPLCYERKTGKRSIWGRKSGSDRNRKFCHRQRWYICSIRLWLVIIKPLTTSV